MLGGLGKIAEGFGNWQNLTSAVSNTKGQARSQMAMDRGQLNSAAIQNHGMKMQSIQNENDINAMNHTRALGQLKGFAEMQAQSTAKTMDTLKQLVR